MNGQNVDPSAAELWKRRTEMFHRVFHYCDFGLSVLCLVMSVVMMVCLLRLRAVDGLSFVIMNVGMMLCGI